MRTSHREAFCNRCGCELPTGSNVYMPQTKHKVKSKWRLCDKCGGAFSVGIDDIDGPPVEQGGVIVSVSRNKYTPHPQRHKPRA